MGKIIINCGGEGEIWEAINCNHPQVLRPDWHASRDTKFVRDDLINSGPLVICESDKLPFANSCADLVIANNVPLDCVTHIGQGYARQELERN